MSVFSIAENTNASTKNVYYSAQCKAKFAYPTANTSPSTPPYGLIISPNEIDSPCVTTPCMFVSDLNAYRPDMRCCSQFMKDALVSDIDVIVLYEKIVLCDSIASQVSLGQTEMYKSYMKPKIILYKNEVFTNIR